MFQSSCAMKMPSPEEGPKGDTGRVNVIYTCLPVTKCNIQTLIIQSSTYMYFIIYEAAAE